MKKEWTWCLVPTTWPEAVARSVFWLAFALMFWVYKAYH